MKIFRFILFVVCAVVSSTITAQTIYYALTSKVQNGNQYTNVSGGQFITFMSDICYESNIKGVGVGHGTLRLNKNYSDNSFKVYIGESYWGSDATFKFKADLSVLNVILGNGDVYVYKKRTAPSSVVTCSLIRKKTGTNTNLDDRGDTFVPNYGNTTGFQNNAGTSYPQKKQETTPSRRQPTKHTCSLCHGQKRIVKDTYPALFGTKDYQVKCNECGGYFMRSTGHTHITCPQCHGKGYFTTD